MKQREQPGTLRAYAGVFGLIILLLLEDLLLVGIMTLFFGRSFWYDYTHSRLKHFQTVTYVGTLYVIVLLTIIGYWKHFTGTSLKEAGLRPHPKWAVEFGTGLLIGCGAIVLYFGPLLCLKLLINPPLQKILQTLATPRFWGHIGLNCAVCLAMAFTEEFFFRGVILNLFLRNVSKFHALIAANALFGLCHMFLPGPWSFKLMYFVTLLIFGIALSSAAIRTKALWCSIGIHFTLIYFILVRGTLAIMDIKRGPWEFFYAYTGHPMAGLWSFVVFSLMIVAAMKVKEESA